MPLGNERLIREWIAKASMSCARDAELDAFIATFRRAFGENLVAVLLYGSCLSASMKKASSFRDFFVVVDDYRTVAKGAIDSIVLPWLPPNLRYQIIEHAGMRIDAKYHLLTLREFQNMSSSTAPDLYVIGRMSKRVGIVHARDEDARMAIQEALGNAFFANARISLPLVTEPVTFVELIHTFLKTSYLSELRLETKDKITEIHDSEREHYDTLYGLLVESLVESGDLTMAGGLYSRRASGTWSRRTTKWYLTKSKIRHMARFPKMIRDMDNWMEQLAGKYERTVGKPAPLTDFDRRHKLLTMVKFFYRMKIKKES